MLGMGLLLTPEDFRAVFRRPSALSVGLGLQLLLVPLIAFLLMRGLPLEIGIAAGLALVVTAMGFLGGLVMSAIKRDRGVKDWGSMIEGHGGILDRLDSVVFAAPIFFHLVRYGWTV